MEIREWSESLNGFDGWFTALQFDMAVTEFGSWVENKLMQHDKKSGKPLFKLDQLLETQNESNSTDKWWERRPVGDTTKIMNYLMSLGSH